MFSKKGKGIVSNRWSKGSRVRKVIADLGTKKNRVWLKTKSGGLRDIRVTRVEAEELTGARS